MSAACVSKALDQLESDILAVMRERSPAWLRSQLAKGAYVYGAGSFGRRIARQMQQKGIPCLGMIDRRAGADMASIDGLPLLHPDAITPEIATGKVFVLGIFNHRDDMGELVRAGRNYGFEHVFWGADLVDTLGTASGDFWLNERRFFSDNFSHVRALATVLGDALSVDVLLSILRFRAVGGDMPVDIAQSREMYLPDDLPGFEGPISFLDGGAYDGIHSGGWSGQGFQSIAGWLLSQIPRISKNWRDLAKAAASNRHSCRVACPTEFIKSHLPRGTSRDRVLLVTLWRAMKVFSVWRSMKFFTVFRSITSSSILRGRRPRPCAG